MLSLCVFSFLLPALCHCRDGGAWQPWQHSGEERPGNDYEVSATCSDAAHFREAGEGRMVKEEGETEGDEGEMEGEGRRNGGRRDIEGRRNGGRRGRE